MKVSLSRSSHSPLDILISDAWRASGVECMHAAALVDNAQYDTPHYELAIIEGQRDKI